MNVRTAGIKELMETSSGTESDIEIYQKGFCVAVIVGGSTNLIERYVQEVSELSGCKVDWYYMDGCAVVKTLPDNIVRVQKAIEDTKLSITMFYGDKE